MVYLIPAHKKYLNDYFQGYDGSSCSRGELYNADPVTGDARFCGTTASMCGVEKAGFEGDDAAMERAIQSMYLHRKQTLSPFCESVQVFLILEKFSLPPYPHF